MHKELRQSLKQTILDELKARKMMTYKEVMDLAHDMGLKEITANRRLQADGEESLPVVKLNARKKPIQGSEPWFYVKYVGAKTVFKV